MLQMGTKVSNWLVMVHVLQVSFDDFEIFVTYLLKIAYKSYLRNFSLRFFSELFNHCTGYATDARKSFTKIIIM